MKPIKHILILIIMTLIMTEAVLQIFLPLNEQLADYSIDDQKLLEKPNSTRKHKRNLEDGSVLFDIVYPFDQFGRRKHLSNSDAGKFALFFGGSFVFGHGLEETDTLAHNFMNKNTEFQVFNYARGSFGPHHMLRQIQTLDINGQVPEKLSRGNAYFFSYIFHNERFMGTSRWQGMISTNDPYYTIENGNPVYQGNFTKARPWQTKINWLIYHSQIIKYFLSGRKYPRNQETVDHLCILTNEAEKILRDTFSNRLENFFFVVPPFQDVHHSRKFYEKVKACLNAGIQFVFYDNAEIYGRDRNKYMLSPEHDIHPNGRANEWLARKLPR